MTYHIWEEVNGKHDTFPTYEAAYKRAEKYHYPVEIRDESGKSYMAPKEHGAWMMITALTVIVTAGAWLIIAALAL